MRVTLCLLCVSVCLTGVGAAALQESEKTEQRAAPLEELNVLMYGVRQFSESLHHIYQTTEAKMDGIARSLGRQEGALERLGQEAVQAMAAEVQIKEMLGLLQAQMVGLHTQTEQTKGRLAHAEQEEEELKRQVTDIETNLTNSALDGVKELQERAKKHSDILRTLRRRNRKQKLNLESQNQRLTKLQRLSEAMR